MGTRLRALVDEVRDDDLKEVQQKLRRYSSAGEDACGPRKSKSGFKDGVP
jgi:hypothetical protein